MLRLRLLSLRYDFLLMQDIVVDGKTVGYGKQVKQVKYAELLGSGHYIANDQPDILSGLLKTWLTGLSEEKMQHITKEKV